MRGFTHHTLLQDRAATLKLLPLQKFLHIKFVLGVISVIHPMYVTKTMQLAF